MRQVDVKAGRQPPSPWVGSMRQEAAMAAVLGRTLPLKHQPQLHLSIIAMLTDTCVASRCVSRDSHWSRTLALAGCSCIARSAAASACRPQIRVRVRVRG